MKWIGRQFRKLIRLVVPIAAGGPSDAAARILAKGMSADLGQEVVVENRPGAAGTPATLQVARAHSRYFQGRRKRPTPMRFFLTLAIISPDVLPGCTKFYDGKACSQVAGA